MGIQLETFDVSYVLLLVQACMKALPRPWLLQSHTLQSCDADIAALLAQEAACLSTRSPSVLSSVLASPMVALHDAQ
jgi:hypothetical protein